MSPQFQSSALAFLIIVAIISMYVYWTEIETWFAETFERLHEIFRGTSVGVWHFECETPGETRRKVGSFYGSAEAASEFIEGNGVMKVTHVDRDGKMIFYAIDWPAYRATVPCNWTAIMMMTDGTQGNFTVYHKKRDAAIKAVLSAGSHYLKRVDDEHRIIFYGRNA